MIIDLYICILRVLSLGIQVARKPTQQDASVQCSLLSPVVTSTPIPREIVYILNLNLTCLMLKEIPLPLTSVKMTCIHHMNVVNCMSPNSTDNY